MQDTESVVQSDARTVCVCVCVCMCHALSKTLVIRSRRERP